MTMSSHHDNKIRWRCRRGVLELDVILHRFFDQHYAHLSSSEQTGFQDLLACEDDQLLAWFFGGESPQSQSLTQIVVRICQDLSMGRMGKQ